MVGTKLASADTPSRWGPLCLECAFSLEQPRCSLSHHTLALPNGVFSINSCRAAEIHAVILFPVILSLLSSGLQNDQLLLLRNRLSLWPVSCTLVPSVPRKAAGSK